MRRQQFRAAQTAVRNRNIPGADSHTLIYAYDSDLNPSRPVRSSPLGSSTIAGLPLELLDRLKAFPLFQSAPESFLLSIGKSLRPSVYQPSQEIVREGEDAKAMYWLVRGSVRVASRDGESTYAVLKPGAFFGEIGILMDVPRTASVVAAVRSMVVRLNKEDLHQELPHFPEIERLIREEAKERLAILERKKSEAKNGGLGLASDAMRQPVGARKRSRDWMAGDVEMGDAGYFAQGQALSNKKRKSPSPGLAEVAASSALGNAQVPIRQVLTELPLFAGLPNDILHFLGVNAHPVSFPPFTEVIKEGYPGRDVYFIIKGEVEVLTLVSPRSTPAIDGQDTKFSDGKLLPTHKVHARLKVGNYFGEVTSLSLAPARTATVRSVSGIECLLISGDVLDELWRKCSPALRLQVESEARRRLDQTKKEEDVLMADSVLDVDTNGSEPQESETQAPDGCEDESDDWRKSLPKVTFDTPVIEQLGVLPPQMEPIDPDPFFNPDLDSIRARSRRSSLAPPIPSEAPVQPLTEHRTPSPPVLRLLSSSPLRPRSLSANLSPSSPLRPSPTATRRPSLDRRSSGHGRGRLPDKVLTIVFRYLELVDLMRFRLVSTHWADLLNNSRDILHHLDLSMYNRLVTDDALRNNIAPFVGSRPSEIDLSNCFHVTDEGFKALAEACGEGAKVWKMKSVWDVQGTAVLSLVERAKGLEEIDLSNCRKVGDNLLARLIGWVVPDKPLPQQASIRNGATIAHSLSPTTANQVHPPAGTIIGAPNLKRLTLSYCKHIQDRSMAHLAAHAADRLESLDLTRCTSISDAAFHAWSVHTFPRLRKLVLADCTYLTDQAIVGVVGACRALLHLDLSFCCALSDTATEVLALGLPHLRYLDMAFCGSAVSDHSLRFIARHLLDLNSLSVRGCVRVTGLGVDAIVDGCRNLQNFDVSQCKNLRPWLDRGGIIIVNAPLERGGKGRTIHFDTVADGTWRTTSR